MNLSISSLILAIQLISLLLLIFLIKQVLSKTNQSGQYWHFGLIRGRDKFNKIGIEITNGSVKGDTLYLILRSGTFSDDFAIAIKRFRSHDETKLIAIVPNSEVFLSNIRSDIQSYISVIYENPNCQNVRAMLLESRASISDTERISGYFFISDGHNHYHDEGFYTVSTMSNKFLLSYIKALIHEGKQIGL